MHVLFVYMWKQDLWSSIKRSCSCLFYVGELSDSDDDEDSDDENESSVTSQADVSVSEDVESTGELDTSDSDVEPSKDEAAEETLPHGSKTKPDPKVPSEKSTKTKKHKKHKKEKGDSKTKSGGKKKSGAKKKSGEKKKSGSKKLKTKKLKSIAWVFDLSFSCFIALSLILRVAFSFENKATTWDMTFTDS